MGLAEAADGVFLAGEQLQNLHQPGHLHHLPEALGGLGQFEAAAGSLGGGEAADQRQGR